MGVQGVLKSAPRHIAKTLMFLLFIMACLALPKPAEAQQAAPLRREFSLPQTIAKGLPLSDAARSFRLARLGSDGGLSAAPWSAPAQSRRADA